MSSGRSGGVIVQAAAASATASVRAARRARDSHEPPADVMQRTGRVRVSIAGEAREQDVSSW